MEQITKFMEKAKSDKELTVKLDALGAKNARPDEIIALAAEYGFTLSEDDLTRFDCDGACQKQQSGQLTEEDLDAVAGGSWADRYNHEICSQYKAPHYYCVGLFGQYPCTHFFVDANPNGRGNKYTCKKGYYKDVVD